MSSGDVRRIPIGAIRSDGGTQVRARLELEMVDEFVEALEIGAVFPPVAVYQDGAIYWLADGFHRLEASKKTGAAEIGCEVLQGDRRAAVLHAVGANADHGLRRTHEDKRRAVELLLADQEWRGESDRQLAERAGVSHVFVASVRAQLETVTSCPAAPRKGRDGRVRKMPKAGTTKPLTKPRPELVPLDELLEPEPAKNDQKLAEALPDAQWAALRKAAAKVERLCAPAMQARAELQRAAETGEDLDDDLRKDAERDARSIPAPLQDAVAKLLAVIAEGASRT